MSVRVMAWVWEHSKSRSTDRLVLLAIADCASDDGGSAFPSMAKLVAKTGLTDRAIQNALARLAALGELRVWRNGGPRGCNRYRVLMSATPEPDSPPNDVHPERRSPPESGSGVTPNDVHPTPERRSPGTVLEPSVEPSEVKNPSPRPDVARICAHLADRIEANGSKRPTITKAWRDAARLMLDKDGRTEEKIIRAIDWCQANEFWRANILSMPKLRERYDALRLAAQRPAGRASPNGQREHNGLMLNERTIADLQRRERLAALDAANERTAIGAP